MVTLMGNSMLFAHRSSNAIWRTAGMPDFDERPGRDAWTAAAEQSLRASVSPAGAADSRAALPHGPAGERSKATPVVVLNARVWCTRDGVGILDCAAVGSTPHGIGANPGRTAGRACAIPAARTFDRRG